jgi:hypothetical protein
MAKELLMKSQRFVMAFTLVNSVLLLTSLVLFVAQSRPTSAKGIPPVLRAHALELVDENGEVRAQFTVEDSGVGVLRLRDETGTIRVKLGADQEGSGLLLLNDETEPGIQMLADSTGTTVTLTAKDGAQQVIVP